jgi:hypothetical protein
MTCQRDWKPVPRCPPATAAPRAEPSVTSAVSSEPMSPGPAARKALVPIGSPRTSCSHNPGGAFLPQPRHHQKKAMEVVRASPRAND